MAKINNPFCESSPLKAKVFDEREFVHYMEVESVSKDFNPEKPSEFLIETHVEEYERIPIDDYVASFSSKVGLKNELKGIVSKSQMDQFIETHKATPGFTDLTILPDSAFEMSQLASKVEKYWDNIPSDLKGSLTKEEFIKTLSVDKIRNYVLSQIHNDEKGE